MKCPKCGSKMTGYTDYDGLRAMTERGVSAIEVRKGMMCTNHECGHEEKAEPETVENPDEGP